MKNFKPLNYHYCLPFWGLIARIMIILNTVFCFGISSLFIFGVLGGGESGASCMLGKCSISKLLPPSSFHFLFWDKISLNCSGRAWTCDPPELASPVTEITGLYHQAVMENLIYIRVFIWYDTPPTFGKNYRGLNETIYVKDFYHCMPLSLVHYRCSKRCLLISVFWRD